MGLFLLDLRHCSAGLCGLFGFVL
uniref:Uncharacterized protein n=1 Tax=Rhizophora mucronata TaxID=61149 RepID=A0A2P2PG12_RHIMU